MSKKKQELTPWFPAHVKPTRSGWYDLRLHVNGPFYWWFDGRRKKWGYGPGDDDCMTRQDHEWRGLAKKP